MTQIDYIRIDDEILRLKICDKAKMLLGLIKRFNNKGLRMSNSELAKLLCCTEDYISKLLKEISAYITIENPQSRYRKVFYSGENNEVDAKQLRQNKRSKNCSTLYFSPVTPSKSTDITKNNINIIYTDFSFVLKNGNTWSLPKAKLDEYKQVYNSRLDIESELRKASQWLIDNPRKRKTAEGMPRFLSGWLGRAKPEKQNNRSHLFTQEQEGAYFDKHISENAPTEEQAEKILSEAGLI